MDLFCDLEEFVEDGTTVQWRTEHLGPEGNDPRLARYGNDVHTFAQNTWDLRASDPRLALHSMAMTMAHSAQNLGPEGISTQDWHGIVWQ